MITEKQMWLLVLTSLVLGICMGAPCLAQNWIISPQEYRTRHEEQDKRLQQQLLEEDIFIIVSTVYGATTLVNGKYRGEAIFSKEDYSSEAFTQAREAFSKKGWIVEVYSQSEGATFLFIIKEP